VRRRDPGVPLLAAFALVVVAIVGAGVERFGWRAVTTAAVIVAMGGAE
jgi:hypothetical protein